MANTPPQSAFGLPYSTIRQAGDYYYLSGHIGIDASKQAAPDIAAQTAAVFENIAASLQQYGLRMNDIIKTTVFLADMDDFAAMNDVYVTYFDEPRPARSTVAVRELPRIGDTPLKVEIEAVAYKPS